MLQNNGKNKIEMDLFEEKLKCELVRLKQSIDKKQQCLTSALSDNIPNADFDSSLKERIVRFTMRLIKQLVGIMAFIWISKKIKSLILSYKKYKNSKLMRGAE